MQTRSRGSGNMLFPEKHSKTSFEKNCFSAWASTLNLGLINKVGMVCDCSDEGLTLETSAKHHIPQATNIP